MDEFAFVEPQNKANEFWTSLSPTLSTGANQVDVIAWIARTNTNIAAQFIGNFS